MLRSWSSSSFTPSLITPPLLTSCGASGWSSRSILSRISSHRLICSPTLLRTSLLACSQAVLIGLMAWRAIFSCTISLGVTLPTATFDTTRSRSPIRWSCSSSSSRNCGSRKKYSTTSSRSLIFFSLFSGNTTHRRNNLLPIGDMVLSMTSRSDFPSSFIGDMSSRLRSVNLSSLTYFSSSILEIDVI